MTGVTTDDWHTDSTTFGSLLESFVVQQLICQATWLEQELSFSHYRDKDQVEVDLVIEQGRNVWGVEVKKSATLHSQDGAGLARLAAQTGNQFQGGMVFYCGTNILPLRTKGCYAMPMSTLWE